MSPRRLIRRECARTLDFAMCALMNRIQRRHRLNGGSLRAFEAYLDQCEALTPAEYFAAAPANTWLEAERGTDLPILRWESPCPSGYPANDRTHVLLFMPHPGAPTVLMLHALASATDRGYRIRAGRFNKIGWNACFVHLPYHYSRVPPGFYNGELALTPDLVHVAQGLRQGVAELRQLMDWLRMQGVAEFGLWGTSYGGLIGALLLGVEPLFRFAVLQAPIADFIHVLWESPATRHIRLELARCGISPALLQRHRHLTFPMGVQPACGAQRVLLAAGVWDQVARAEDVTALHRVWPGSALLTVEQGHFGFRMADECFAYLAANGLLRQPPLS